MLKNTKFLYSVIAVLTAVCIVLGIHITKDFEMMLNNRYFLIFYTGTSFDIISNNAKEALECEYKTEEFENNLAKIKNSLETLTQRIEFIFTFYPHNYNVVNSVNDFISYSPSGTSFEPYSLDFVLSELANEAETIENYYKENGNLTEEHIKWLESISSASDELIEELYYTNKEGELELSDKYYKEDKEFCNLISEFLEKMYSVSIS